MNYSVTNFPKDLINDILRNKEDTLTKGNINDKSGLTKRNSSVSWINRYRYLSKSVECNEKQYCRIFIITH